MGLGLALLLRGTARAFLLLGYAYVQSRLSWCQRASSIRQGICSNATLQSELLEGSVLQMKCKLALAEQASFKSGVLPRTRRSRELTHVSVLFLWHNMISGVYIL